MRKEKKATASDLKSGTERQEQCILFIAHTKHIDARVYQIKKIIPVQSLDIYIDTPYVFFHLKGVQMNS